VYIYSYTAIDANATTTVTAHGTVGGRKGGKGASGSSGPKGGPSAAETLAEEVGQMLPMETGRARRYNTCCSHILVSTVANSVHTSTTILYSAVFLQCVLHAAMSYGRP
jgi:hypothetical protein